MKFGKRIAAFGVAVMMAMSMAGISASAKEYAGGANKTKAWLTKNGNADNRYVKDINGGGRTRGTIYASYSWVSGVKCTSSGADCIEHYARVVSGGRDNISDTRRAYYNTETDSIPLVNKSARFEGWYTV